MPSQLADEPELLDASAGHDVVLLAVTWGRACELRLLSPLHRVPFDRLPIAKARVERRTLVTADPQVRAYDVASMPA